MQSGGPGCGRSVGEPQAGQDSGNLLLAQSCVSQGAEEAFFRKDNASADERVAPAGRRWVRPPGGKAVERGFERGWLVLVQARGEVSGPCGGTPGGRKRLGSGAGSAHPG